MRRTWTFGLIGLLTLSAGALSSASVPRALAPALGGLGEGRRQRTVVSDRGSETLISYTCNGGGFGQSKVTLITPRSLRIETQGISEKLPFNYQLHARRIGGC